MLLADELGELTAFRPGTVQIPGIFVPNTRLLDGFEKKVGFHGRSMWYQLEVATNWGPGWSRSIETFLPVSQRIRVFPPCDTIFHGKDARKAGDGKKA